MATRKNKLSAAVLGLVLAGAPASVILDQFLNEKEGNTLTACKDGSGIWTICRGATMVDGKPVVQGMKLTQAKCDQVNSVERDKALAWVDRNIKVPLTEPQKAGIASFCPYNIGPGKCLPSTFYKRLNAGDRKGACEAIRWWIKDGGRDCRQTKGKKNGCYGQVERRDQESALACWGMSYGHLWCMGIRGGWRILLIDFFPDFNNREMIRHDQVYPAGLAWAS